MWMALAETVFDDAAGAEKNDARGMPSALAESDY